PRAREQARRDRDRQAHAVNTDPWREAGERRVGLAVTQVEPGKAGEEPTARPFEQHPGGRHAKHGVPAAAEAREPRLQPPRGRGEQREPGDEQGDGDSRERRRHVSVRVQAHVHPRHADAEEAEAVEKTASCRAPGRGGVPRHEQYGGREQGREVAAAARAGRVMRGGGKRHLFYSAGCPAAGARMTFNKCTRRLSARSTSNWSPSIAMRSPRRGSRPNFVSTSPPTVSTSLSLKCVPKYELKSAMGV